MKLLLILLSAISFQLSACAAEAAPIVSAEELLGNPEQYDGESVAYTGEVIGDIFRQQGAVWINVRDQSGVIGIFYSQGLSGAIKHTGGYKFRGDIVSVRGIFHHACAEHGGDTDIHAERIIVIEQGRAIAHPLIPERVRLSIILPAIALCLAIIHLIVRRFR